MSDQRLRVCIVLEGSYPYITGGVSAWVHDLIANLPEIDFVLFTISPEADQPLRYQLPENVVESRDIILTEAVGEPDATDSVHDLLTEIGANHREMFSGGAPSLDAMIDLIPEGYSLSRAAVDEDESWDLIVESNQQRNPLYPFSDYFWAWKSSHQMIFNVLAAKAPEADIYHAVSTGFAGLAALAAQRRHGKPFLLTEHGLYHKEREIEIRKADFVKGYQRDMWIKIYNKLSTICYRSATMVTALFEENRQKQIELGAHAHNTVVIPNGIDIERFASVTREKRDGFMVGLVGRIVPIKDIKTFIATSKIILDEIPGAEIFAIGPTDEDQAYYEECVKLVKSLQMEDRFHFTGRQNVLEYYNFLDVMLLTSIREAQPLVILEAWSAGVPVVSTRVGNVAEMLDYDDRFIAPSKDAAKLAAGVKYIYDHPDEMKEIMAKNQRKVRELYDKLDLHRRYRELYRDLTVSSGTSGSEPSPGTGETGTD
jgi:glycosyltransferase involved in cell wall biosynthesis